MFILESHHISIWKGPVEIRDIDALRAIAKGTAGLTASIGIARYPMHLRWNETGPVGHIWNSQNLAVEIRRKFGWEPWVHETEIVFPRELAAELIAKGELQEGQHGVLNWTTP